MKYILLSFLLYIWSGYVIAQNERIIQVHSDNTKTTYCLNDIDSISFGELSKTEKIEIERTNKEAIISSFHKLMNLTDDATCIYHDFSQSYDTDNVYNTKTQSGHTILVNGDGAQNTSVKDGMTINNVNYRLYVRGNEPLKYIGMTFSYHQVADETGDIAESIPPCVILLGQKTNTWEHIIHILFYEDKLFINTRDGGDFRTDCINVGGDGRYTKKSLGEKYNVSVYIEENKLYIRKPNGKYLIMQNDYFREAFPVACWQVFNKPEYNIQGRLHEIYAGPKPYIETVWREKNK